MWLLEEFKSEFSSVLICKLFWFLFTENVIPDTYDYYYSWFGKLFELRCGFGWINSWLSLCYKGILGGMDNIYFGWATTRSTDDFLSEERILNLFVRLLSCSLILINSLRNVPLSSIDSISLS